MSIVPVELEDLIIGHMQGDKDALASCSLVSRLWLYFSRPYLFGSVTIRDHTYEDFLQLKASQLCTFIPSIRTLSICRPGKDGYSDVDFIELIPKLAGFPSLTCLRVFFVPWTDPSAAAFFKTFHNITVLEIGHTTFRTPHQIIVLLGQLPRLEKVTAHVKFQGDGTWIEPLPGRPDPPRSLKVVQLHLECVPWDSDPWKCIFRWIVEAPAPTIRALGLGKIMRQDLAAVGTFLRTLRPVIRDLNLNLFRNVTADDIEMDFAPHLACMTQITHLTVHNDISPVGHLTHWYSSLAVLAALSRSPAVLETLTVVFTIESIVDRLDDLDWVHFYAAVRAHARLRLLRFRVRDYYTDVVVAMEKIRNRVAPEFATQGSVEVESCEADSCS